MIKSIKIYIEDLIDEVYIDFTENKFQGYNDFGERSRINNISTPMCFYGDNNSGKSLLVFVLDFITNSNRVHLHNSDIEFDYLIDDKVSTLKYKTIKDNIPLIQYPKELTNEVLSNIKCINFKDVDNFRRKIEPYNIDCDNLDFSFYYFYLINVINDMKPYSTLIIDDLDNYLDYKTIDQFINNINKYFQIQIIFTLKHPSPLAVLSPNQVIICKKNNGIIRYDKVSEKFPEITSKHNLENMYCGGRFG